MKKKTEENFQKYKIDIRVVFSSFKIRNYFSLKDKSDTLLRSSLIYKYQCLDDPSCAYIGKTKRYLNKRVNEHRTSNSAIGNHLQNCTKCKSNEDFFSNFSVIDRADEDFDLQILEALHIIKNRPKLNKQLSNDGATYILNIF